MSIKKKDNKSFPSTTKRFIAYFDIMGFKDLVYRSSHKKVMKVMDKVCDATKLVECIENMGHLTGKKGITVCDLDSAIVIPVVFSDSILFISKSGSSKDACRIIRYSSLFLYNLLKDNVPVKGALSYGTFTADFAKSSFFGRPLIDAYLLANDVNFYGAVLHNTFDCYIKQNSLEMYTSSFDLKCAPVPMKNRDITHSYIDWRGFAKKSANEINSIIHKFYDGVSGNTRLYVDNTLRLYGKKT